LNADQAEIIKRKKCPIRRDGCSHVIAEGMGSISSRVSGERLVTLVLKENKRSSKQAKDVANMPAKERIAPNASPK